MKKMKSDRLLSKSIFVIPTQQLQAIKGGSNGIRIIDIDDDGG